MSPAYALSPLLSPADCRAVLDGLICDTPLPPPELPPEEKLLPPFA